MALSVLRFHSPLGYPWTFNLFAVLVACWLSREISRYRVEHPPSWLEWAGRWSYSLYLVHLPANAFVSTFALPNLGPALNWLVLMGLILSVSYLFYLAVELPGHVAARAAALALAPGRGGLPPMNPLTSSLRLIFLDRPARRRRRGRTFPVGGTVSDAPPPRSPD